MNAPPNLELFRHRVFNHPDFGGVFPTLLENLASPSGGEKNRLQKISRTKILDFIFKNLTFKNSDFIYFFITRRDILVKFKFAIQFGSAEYAVLSTSIIIDLRAGVCFQKHY